MNKERLEHLVTILKSDKVNKPGKFYLGTWSSGYQDLISFVEDDPPFPNADITDEFLKNLKDLDNSSCAKNTADYIIEPLENGYSKMVPVDCKTVSCACGWAASDEKFMKEGLYLYKEDPDDLDESVEIAYKDHIGFYAAAAFFDISYTDAELLFSPHKYSQKDVLKTDEILKRIDSLLHSNLCTVKRDGFEYGYDWDGKFNG